VRHDSHDLCEHDMKVQVLMTAVPRGATARVDIPRTEITPRRWIETLLEERW